MGVEVVLVRKEGLKKTRSRLLHQPYFKSASFFLAGVNKCGTDVIAHWGLIGSGFGVLGVPVPVCGALGVLWSIRCSERVK